MNTDLLAGMAENMRRLHHGLSILYTQLDKNHMCEDHKSIAETHETMANVWSTIQSAIQDGAS